MTDVKNLSCTFEGRNMKAEIENTEENYKSFKFECVFEDEEGTEYKLASTAGIDGEKTVEVASDTAPEGKKIVKLKGKSLIEDE